MKRLSLLGFLLVFLHAGCAHRPAPLSSTAPPEASFPPLLIMVAAESGTSPGAPAASQSTPISPHAPAQSGGQRADQKGTPGGEEQGKEEEAVTIRDPLEPFNRAMFKFNDKLYFWVLKPVGKAYSKVVPEPARVSVNNFFHNARFPIRFVSCLLQADLRCAGSELGRFTVNTVWGAGGLLDPASKEELQIPKIKADLGQTLGVYGLGHGFYIIWPILGPSSPRDSAQIIGEYFLYPVGYITPWYDWLAVRGLEEVNDVSLRIGDYEALKEAAIDPYVALRDAYAQYRLGLVEQRRGKTPPPKPGGVMIK